MLPDPPTLATLLQELKITGRYAVEVNQSIVPRSRHGSHELRRGDRVEIVQAIGGG